MNDKGNFLLQKSIGRNQTSEKDKYKRNKEKKHGN